MLRRKLPDPSIASAVWKPTSSRLSDSEFGALSACFDQFFQRRFEITFDSAIRMPDPLSPKRY
jgi:hypothetical protein